MSTGQESGDYYRPAIDWDERRYVRGCEICHQFKESRDPRHGITILLDTLSRP